MKKLYTTVVNIIWGGDVDIIDFWGSSFLLLWGSWFLVPKPNLDAIVFGYFQHLLPHWGWALIFIGIGLTRYVLLAVDRYGIDSVRVPLSLQLTRAFYWVRGLITGNEQPEAWMGYVEIMHARIIIIGATFALWLFVSGLFVQGNWKTLISRTSLFCVVVALWEFMRIVNRWKIRVIVKQDASSPTTL